MIERAELSALVRSIGSMVRDHCGILIRDAAAILSTRIDILELRIKEIPAGPKGDKGDPGESIRGERGAPGESIKGDKGDPGPIGPAGPRGETGEQGLSIVGERGANGIDGKDGKDGRDGREGKDGRDGMDGKDALQIEILPAIDPEKSYPRGTWAYHNGGLIHAGVHTEPAKNGIIKGWDVIVRGIAGGEVIQGNDPRDVSVRYWMTDGEEFSLAVHLPVLIYREIYREGETYDRGDVVTFGGSAWHCQEKTQAKPGSGAAWKLMIKEGRAGKDGKDGERGPEGKPGK